MSYTHYDRLSALDSSFLENESHVSHMHVGSVGLFDAKPLRAAHGGGLDQERILAASEAGAAHNPRFRQKLALVPLFGSPVWVDDEHFNLNYHIRFTALPAPGDIRQLKRLTGRIMSTQLDRGKPLWEIWFVEGVEGDRVAIISKAHHCMIDGISGVDLMASMMKPVVEERVAAPGKWLPRPAPTPARLLVDEVLRRATVPLLVARAGRELLRDPIKGLRTAGEAANGLIEALSAGLTPASPSPLNVDIGPHRRFDWTRLDLDAVKAIKQGLGGTLNDVVLAIVAGAMRRFLRARGERVAELDFRVMVPVNVRVSEQQGALGNRVSFLMTRLPVGERDPRQRLRQVIETTQQLKGSRQAQGAQLLEEISDHTFASLFIQLARMGAQSLSYNMVVTNVPGPPFRVYFLGSPLREVYPLVPLFENQGLGIALFSYDGGLYWGFNADWEAVPDLHDVVGDIEQEFRLLADAARAAMPAVKTAKATPKVKRAPRRQGGHRKARSRRAARR
ncbi:MAG TPA: wax ester/triacylglycerol synthase family O-acyltransferase [Candidatus Dormibacteraeota bacterium]|nr:wax ester/triacylglycerol synthase family O-acyltransferase [Candidatus Dormibacteraeota bacterium]